MVEDPRSWSLWPKQCLKAGVSHKNTHSAHQVMLFLTVFLSAIWTTRDSYFSYVMASACHQVGVFKGLSQGNFHSGGSFKAYFAEQGKVSGCRHTLVSLDFQDQRVCFLANVKAVCFLGGFFSSCPSASEVRVEIVVNIPLSDFPGKPFIVATSRSCFNTARVKIKIWSKLWQRDNISSCSVSAVVRSLIRAVFTHKSLCVGQLYSVRWPQALRLNAFSKPARLSSRTAVLSLVQRNMRNL